ncbi:transcriptional regulator ATRX homolog [Astyanax mexicanus]|uniref:transcriptional regulator ATRX homolog n=1 Tax=Astyanax mexicanus TaxID=7994 RepID=UPI000BBD5EF7|nr:transcriptional regulator ATRX homolog [Astyanax mexicanus]
MDESTFEMFDDELGTPLQDVPPQKSFRTGRRTGTETYVQRRVREEPPIVQQIPKAVPREAPISRAMPLRKALSIQNIAQIDIPWEGVTLNRCLIIAITILVVTSGLQRLGEAIRGRKDGSDVDAIDTALNMRHTAIRKGRLPPPQPETSLWDTFWSWVSDDDDDDDKRGKRGKSRKGAQESSNRGLRHKAIPNRNLLKGRQDRFKARREKAREQDEEETKERVKGQRAKEKRLKQEKLEEEEQEKQKTEKEEKIPKKKSKEGKKKDKDRKE